jgi:hypothetical protein
LNAGELLAKVTAKAVPFEQAISGFGRFTSEDILHSLGLIPHSGAVLLLRVKYCGQKEFVQELDIHFWTTIGDLALQERWPYPIRFKGKEFYRNMGRIALSELIEPRVCLECGGTAIQITPEGRLIDCVPCRGTGRSNHSDRSRSRLIGMPWETWRQGWNDRYKQVQGIADTWESMGLGGMVKRLKTA